MNKKLIRACAAALLLATVLTACNTVGSGENEETTQGKPDQTTSAEGTTADTTAPDQPVTEPEVTAKPLALVKDGASNYVIHFNSDDCRVPAYTLQEVVDHVTDVKLSVSKSTDAECTVELAEGDAATLGNYGYEISASGSCLNVKAASLAGFDMAFARLMKDCTDGKSVTVPTGYAVGEKLNWESDYVLEGDDYNPEYNNGTFYNDKNDSVAYVSNAMWHMFGLIDDGQNLVYDFGNEPTYYEWMSEKMVWSGDANYIDGLKGRLRGFPQVSTGYMWSWSTNPYWQVGDTYSIHYDGTFRYIASVYDIISWEGNTTFLYELDGDTFGGEYGYMDASQGRTILEKTEACMSYILDYLHGRDGYILLTEESTYLTPDGSERFDYVIATGENCWNNTGKDGANASNYWDNLPFGGSDGYSNALFYNALQSMSGIYRMLGGDYIAKAEELEALAVTVKEKFNEMYWSDETGRYIACIDSDGRRVDYGLTFHNFEILKYGLADADRAKSIFDWIDGDRIVEGDTQTGEAIMSYVDKFTRPSINHSESKEMKKLKLRLAAVTNTLRIDLPENKESGTAWWHAPAAIDVWSNAAYHHHLENGGYIFYPVFYELMARTQYEGAQSTTDRLMQIADVYEYNRLNSDRGMWIEGLVGEFPESGLVPTTYMYSLMGVNASYDGLHVAPVFNDVYEYMGVKEIRYNGRSYDVRVNRDASCVITPADGTVDMTLNYTPERFSAAAYTVVTTYTDGTTTEINVTPNNGVICVELNAGNVASVTISPVLGK